MTHYLFQFSNGEAHGWGKDYRLAAQKLVLLKRKIEVGMLVRIITDNPPKITYWDGREFIKELKKGDKKFIKKHSSHDVTQ